VNPFPKMRCPRNETSHAPKIHLVLLMAIPNCYRCWNNFFRCLRCSFVVFDTTMAAYRPRRNKSRGLDFVHEPLKDLRCVAQTKSHERGLELSEKSCNSGLRYVFFLNRHLLVNTNEVDY